MKKIYLLFTILIIFAQASFAQTANQYTFTTNGTSSLAADLNGNVIDMSTGTTQLVAASKDDIASSVTNIGFNFTFMGTGGTNNIFTQFSASSNGGIELGGTAISGTLQAFPTSASTPVIAPFLGDLATSSTGKVHYKVFGCYPNRTLVVEFLNMNIKYSSTTVDGTFQARLYEQTNTIEFVYGAMKVGTASAPVNIGFYNTTGTNNEFSVNESSPYATTTAATPVTNANSSTGNITGLNSSANGSRRAFMFTPTLAYKSQFIFMNTGSTTWCAGETRNVTVTIKNIGTATWTDGTGGTPIINIGAKFNANSDYDYRVSAANLSSVPPGNQATYTIPITAPSSASTTENISFDVVKEGACWFRDNIAGCAGPGNMKFTSSLFTGSNQTIVALPSITTQPGNKTACQGSGTSFTVAATGTSLSYQWQVSTDNGSTWNNLSNTGVYTNSTTATLNISNVTGLNGYQYRVAVTSSGSCSVTSTAATLAVNALPTASISYASSPYCSNGGTAAVTQTGTTGGTYASTTGLSINASTGAINLSASTAGAYTVTYSFTNGTCPNTTTASITITALPVATFSYTGTPYCQSATNPSPTFSGGGAAGTFSSTSGLVFVSTSTGQVNLSASTPGTYTVTNTRAAASGCSQVTATSPITITAAPSATISYAGSPYCKSLTSGLVTQSGTTGGTYSSTTGLSINPSTGEINPSTSTAGNYTVTYTVAAAGGCSIYTTTASVTITAIPVATFSYTGTPYCQNASNPSPTYSGGGAAGTFSSTTGLVFVSTSTGQVNLSASTPGTYTVTNTRAASGGCSQVSATSPITITTTPSATISYAGSPYCSTGGTASVTRTGTAGGTYSSTTGLVINSANGDITLGTSTAGTYTVTYTVAAAGGCSLYSTTASVTVNAAPAISSSGQPASQTTCAGNAKTFTVNATGTSPTYQWQYSADGLTNWNSVVSGTPANITYTNSTTASLTVTPSSVAVSGTYYYRCIVSVSSCSSINSNAASLTVNALPTASISYSSSPYCVNAGAASVTRTGTSGGTYSASPAGLSINSSTGNITLASSTAGTYTVTYSFSNSTTGCSNTTTASVTVNPIPTGVTASASPNPVCAGSVVNLTSLPSSTLLSQNFNNGLAAWTTINSSSGGTVSASTWTLRPDGYSYNYTYHSNDNSQFIQSNSDAQGSNQNYTYTSLISPTFSTVGLSACSLNFYQYYRESLGDYFIGSAEVDISTNGGSTWTTLHDYADDGGTGSAGSFAHSILDLSNYVGYSSVQIRFLYYSPDGYYWSLDNITVAGNGIGAPYTYAWTSTPSGFTSTIQNPTATPTANTTYNLAVTNSYGCVATTSTAVTVKPLPTASITTTPTTGSACEGTSVSVNLSGTSGASVNYSVNPGSATNPVTLPTLPVNSPTNQGDYTYTITSVSLNGCNGTAGSNTTVHIYANPNTAITANSFVQIDGMALTLTGATSGGTWSADNSNLTLGTPTGSIIPATAVTPGTTNVTYSVSQVHDATTTCASTTSKPVTITAQFVTRADGNFSDFSTWNIYSQTGATASTSPIPANSNSVEVQHALTLNTDYTSGKYFAITGSGSMVIPPTHYFASSAGTVSFGGKPVLIQSTSAGSGAIGQITGTTIAGADHITAERYVNGGDPANGRRAWRLITAPVTGVTMNAGWQEGQVYNNSVTPETNYLTGTTNAATKPVNYGTLITSNIVDASAANSIGYDYTSGTTSIKQYTPGTTGGTWGPLLDNQSTTNPKAGTLQDIRTLPSYMLFVRGDRSIGANTALSSITTLRPQGSLNQGSQIIGTVHAAGNLREVAGNPYASAIDFSTVHSQNASLIKDQFAVWVSRLGTYGAYTFVKANGDGTYTATPSSIDGSGGSGTVQPANDRYIQSGEGFLVYPTGTATGDITVDETVKAPDQQSTALTSTFRIVNTDKKLYVNLKLKNSDTSATLADGFLVRFDPTYTNDIDGDDATKPSNFNENLGVLSHGSNLIVEARADVQKTDTVQTHLWNMAQRAYQLQLKGINFGSVAGLHAFLEDSYLGTKQEVNLSGTVATVDFAVNGDTASKSASRFRIVFQNDAAVLPVTLTSVKAAPQNGGVTVTWSVTNEVNIKGYTVERSTNGGASYTAVATQDAKNNPAAAITNYQSFDALPKTGDNLYRIRIENKDGSVTYSSTVKVTIGADNGKMKITLYPNPVKSNGTVHVQLSHLLPGDYLLSVYSNGGQTVYQKKITIGTAGSTQSETIALNNTLAQGSYSVKIADSKGGVVFTDQLVVAR